MAAPQHSVVSSDEVAALRPLVRHILAARIDDTGEVEDLVQDCLSRLFDQAGRLEPEALAGYAVVVARNAAASHRRRQQSRHRHLHRLIEVRALPDPADEAIRHEDIVALNDALARLHPIDRHALIAHELQGVDMASLAAELSSTPGAVASRLGRSRAQMRVDYVLAVRRARLPTPRCRPVLLALSAADGRRQRALDAGGHLAECSTCAELSPALIERRRGALVILPFAVAGRSVLTAARWMKAHPLHSAAGTLTAGAAAATIVSAARTNTHHPVVAPPTAPVSTTVAAKPPLSVIVGGVDLLAQASGGSPAAVFASYRGQAVQARGILIEALAGESENRSQLDDERFFVGEGTEPRVLVFVHANTELPFQVSVGQRYDFIGTIRAVPGDLRTLQLNPSAATQAAAAGSYIEVTDLTSLHQTGP